MFGGMSAEHEVSVITGLQVLENIDRKEYRPRAVYQTQVGEFLLLPEIKTRKDFKPEKSAVVSFGKDAKGPFIQQSGLLGGRIYPYAAFLAFHGGSGEDGRVQGLLESITLPHTSPSVEASATTMNKSLTKEVIRQNGIPVLEWVSLKSCEIKEGPEKSAELVLKKFSLPLIIKPAHLGSSIGVNVARDKVELQKFLLAASMMDKEIVVEKYLGSFKEYNCAVRKINGAVETSEIEKPLSKDEILSFADKYQRGGKKTGGMASLAREIPARIPEGLRKRLMKTAKKAFLATRCESMVRIDFMVAGKDEIYVTEINPIPGSLAFYLWEASGISFREQITQLIEQSVKDMHDALSKKLEYKTDIVQKFVSGQ